MTERLDLTGDVVDLTAAVCDIESVSGDEAALADAVEAALTAYEHLSVSRDGNTVIARTQLGRPERVVIAGHLDTVPIATDPTTGRPNVPTRRDGDRLVGRGTTDMKGGVAVALALAARVTAPSRDVTYVFYDCEEVEAARNGLARIAGSTPEVLDADFAVLMEPTNGGIEGGCKGTLRVHATTHGTAAHSGRPWLGDNAIHKAGEILRRLEAHEARTVDVDGLTYHEGMSAVGITGGIATNVIPDACTVTINYRFAPDLTGEQAGAVVADLLDGTGATLQVDDLAEGARPGLETPAARAFVAALDLPVTAKEGWTDVARFTAVGVPAVNFGPGDPALAHTDGEWCDTGQITQALERMSAWLS